MTKSAYVGVNYWYKKGYLRPIHLVMISWSAGVGVLRNYSMGNSVIRNLKNCIKLLWCDFLKAGNVLRWIDKLHQIEITSSILPNCSWRSSKWPSSIPNFSWSESFQFEQKKCSRFLMFPKKQIKDKKLCVNHVQPPTSLIWETETFTATDPSTVDWSVAKHVGKDWILQLPLAVWKMAFNGIPPTIPRTRIHRINLAPLPAIGLRSPCLMAIHGDMDLSNGGSSSQCFQYFSYRTHAKSNMKKNKKCKSIK